MGIPQKARENFLTEEEIKLTMNALSLRVFTDFNAAAARCSPTRGGYGVSSFGEFNGKGCRILACASRNGNGGGRSSSSSSSSSPSTTANSFLSRSQTYALLKQQMEVAAKSEVGVFSVEFHFGEDLSLYFVFLFVFLRILGKHTEPEAYNFRFFSS